MIRPLLLSISILLSLELYAQVELNANGPGETYELINSVLAPGYDVVEVPDCKHSAFGRHIDEVYDNDLEKYVFRFHIHVTPDNDRCINTDRQRNEIKSYDKSPANLKAVVDETVMYEWQFKIDSGFQSSSSFTHLHQIKAVGGTEESMPLITFTARKGSPDKLELRYAKNTSQSTLKKVDLDPFKGEWVSVKEIITYGETGRYNVRIERLSDGLELFTYSHNNIRMWKTGASFLRPKWGIYRSLNVPSDLRDEMVYFSDFKITEGDISLSIKDNQLSRKLTIYPNPANDFIQFSHHQFDVACNLIIIDQLGRTIINHPCTDGDYVDISQLERGLYIASIRMGDKTIAVTKLLKK